MKNILILFLTTFTALPAAQTDHLVIRGHESFPSYFHGRQLVDSGVTKPIRVQLDSDNFLELNVPLFAFYTPREMMIQSRDIERIEHIHNEIQTMRQVPIHEFHQPYNQEALDALLDNLFQLAVELTERLDPYEAQALAVEPSSK